MVDMAWREIGEIRPGREEDRCGLWKERRS